jgi:hypothetical protein
MALASADVLGETILFGHGRFVHRSREAPAPFAGEDPDLVRVAEGATAPESLRQKDRVGGRTLWKAGSGDVAPPKG